MLWKAATSKMTSVSMGFVSALTCLQAYEQLSTPMYLGRSHQSQLQTLVLESLISRSSEMMVCSVLNVCRTEPAESPTAVPLLVIYQIQVALADGKIVDGGSEPCLNS